MPSPARHIVVPPVDEMNGHRQAAALQGHLARLDRVREEIVKAWLVDVILGSSLAEVEATPMEWATKELPQLISDIIAAVGEGGRPRLPPEGLARAARLAELRAEAPPEQLARDISSLQSTLLAALREELPASERELFAEAAERIATVFGLVSGTAVDALLRQSEYGRDPLTGLSGPGQLRHRLVQAVAATTRYGNPFALVLVDFEGPGTREGEPSASNREGLLRVVAGALRGGVRVMDEAFRLEDDQLCVLAPNQTVADGARMAERLAGVLADLEAAGGLRITISAGVVSCPESGDDPEQLLRQADTAMWRARATGRSVAVGGLQDR